ncbi:MAG: HlyD family efflux transporter periplasmic adaptor subunit [Bryobacteraceae bacterium]|nr:HlyD family efflux transporter periplasmic adaptor subunit [Bryobacteraceae bacterium]
MPTAFLRTLRSFETDTFGRSALILSLGAAILGGWGAWCVLGRITLYEISDSARLEVDRANYAVQSPMLGRITATYLSLGRQVMPGDPLVELDASAQRLQLREEQTRLAVVTPQLESLRRQVAAEDSAREDERRATESAVEEARARTRQSEAPAQYNSAEEKRLRELRDLGLIAQREYEKGRADALETQRSVEREKIAVERIGREQRTRETDREARIRGLHTEISRLEGQAATSRAIISTLQNEIELRVIRAPIAGKLAEAAILRVGAVLKEGDKIGVIVPGGKVIVVAQFSPPAALGRVAPGQSAQVRLEGFPWMQWGTVPAVVERVAGEVRDGAVRVELGIDTSGNVRIPLQHGLPGTAEVAVERISPASLILRTAGSLLAAPRSAYAVSPQP